MPDEEFLSEIYIELYNPIVKNATNPVKTRVRIE